MPHRVATSCCIYILLTLAWSFSTSAQEMAIPDRQAERAWINANIYTMDPDRPRADSIAVIGDEIVAIGSYDQIRPFISRDTLVHDLRGQTMLPGLIDAHGHLSGLGNFGLGEIDLTDAGSFEGLVTTIQERASTSDEGEWITGGRWDHESWPSKSLPEHDELSNAVPDHPVWLTRVDGHAGLANKKAMDLAGITSETPDPPGGEILRDENGEPTGVFVDTAEELIVRHIVRTRAPTTADLLLKAQEMCFSVGLTGVHQAGSSPQQIEVMQQLEASGDLKLRIYVMVSGPYAMRYFSENDPVTGERVTVRAAKLYMDGAMGSRGAWMLEPYADRPTDEEGNPYTGLAVSEPSVIFDTSEHALAHGYQVCTHAIGDRGNREVLDAYERAFRNAGEPGDHRFRVEHAQLLHPDDIPRFAEMGVIPSMQATHCTSDMRWVDARVGPTRALGAYAWASLLQTGVPIANGSDFPVEHHNPFLGFYASVTRQNSDGEPAGGWMPHERMTRHETLRSMTIDAAYAAFEEDIKGSLEVGKLADFIVLDRDVMHCPPMEILETRVLRTIVGGETVYLAD